MPYLETLILDDCGALEFLPYEINEMNRLKWLAIRSKNMEGVCW